MTRALRSALILVVLAALASMGLVVAPSTAAGSPRLQVPYLHWGSCGPEAPPGLQCATALVPLDYDEPRGRKISLALARVPAADQARRIGTVFLNPGGPGGSGVDFAFGVGPDIADQLQGRFDVVGFDPRGVGASTPLRCFDTEDEEWSFFGTQPVFPYQPGQERSYFDTYNRYTAECLAHGGHIRSHMSTADVARDLDLLRQAVGDERLTYLGFSYGSYLGNTYANLFPGRVRALVIDGVLDPVRWSSGRQIEHDRTSAELVLREFFRLCDAAGSACAFDSASSARTRYERLAERLLIEPATISEQGFTYIYSYDFLIGDSVGFMYAPEAWPEFAELLDAVADAVESGAGARRVAALRTALLEQLIPDRAESEDYPNFLDAYYGNHCADAQYPQRFVQWSAVGREAGRASRSGPYWWWANAPCATWPTNADRYAGPWTATTSAPVLVVGNFFDPATDYRGAVASDELLGNSRLLSYAGWGHTAYSRSACATTVVNAYLLSGALPPEGTVCPANPNPFLQSSAQSRTRIPGIGLPPEWPLR
jgi:pimeloyl-ACP methyl ester carboxylesterase